MLEDQSQHACTSFCFHLKEDAVTSSHSPQLLMLLAIMLKIIQVIQLTCINYHNNKSDASWPKQYGLTILGDSGFCSKVVTCVPARLRRLFTLTGVFSSPGRSARFTEGRETGLGIEGERNRLRGRHRITG